MISSSSFNITGGQLSCAYPGLFIESVGREDDPELLGGRNRWPQTHGGAVNPHLPLTQYTIESNTAIHHAHPHSRCSRDARYVRLCTWKCTA
jgi:hypothetical protein